MIDNGIGMNDVVRARLFEPFFTTKGAGRGTGLGLATSYAIVRDHEGTVTCESVQGVGTTMTITLPTTTDAPRVRAARSEAPETSARRVLLVDDEAAVRTTLSYVLSEAGMTVLLADSGQAALDVLARQSVEVVLLDRSMPGGAGETYIARIRALCAARTHSFFVGTDGRAVGRGARRRGRAEARNRSSAARRDPSRFADRAARGRERAALTDCVHANAARAIEFKNGRPSGQFQSMLEKPVLRALAPLATVLTAHRQTDKRLALHYGGRAQDLGRLAGSHGQTRSTHVGCCSRGPGKYSPTRLHVRGYAGR